MLALVRYCRTRAPRKCIAFVGPSKITTQAREKRKVCNACATGHLFGTLNLSRWRLDCELSHSGGLCGLLKGQT
jgi:hypothetical protein